VPVRLPVGIAYNPSKLDLFASCAFAKHYALSKGHSCQSSLLTLVSGGLLFNGSYPVNAARTLSVSPAKSGATGKQVSPSLLTQRQRLLHLHTVPRGS
jgi:hypothetical protein